ncbi:unnamed protein product, partial [marine sediment metagenome]
MVSLAFGFVGLVLNEIAVSGEQEKEGTGDLLRLYGEPISHCALVLPVFAILLSFVMLIPQAVDNISRVAGSELLIDVELGPLATVLLFAAAVYLIG